jgi:hypothetical protein
MEKMRTLLKHPERYQKTLIAAACILIVLYLGILTMHAAARKPWNDEAMSARAGFNLGYKGHTGVEFYDEKTAGFPGVSRHSYYIFPFQLPFMAVWYKIFGFSLFTTRMLSLTWTCGLLIAWFYVLRRLTLDPAIALLGTALAAVDYHMMSAASFGRYDTMVAALGYGSYAFYLGLREKNLTLAILVANACVAGSGATHPNGVFYLVGLCLMIGILDRRRLGWKELGAAAIPYVIGGAIWASFIMEDLPSFTGQMKRNSGGRFGILRPFTTLMLEIQVRYIAAFGLGTHSAGHDSPLIRLKAFPLLAYVAGILGCMLSTSIRRNPNYRLVFLLSTVHVLLMTFYENMKFSYYLVHLLPFYGALLAIWIVTLWRQRRISAFVLTGAVALVIAVQVGGILMKIRLNDHDKVYLPAVTFLKAYARPNEQVAAACSLGFAYGFDGLRDDESFGFISGQKPDLIVMEEIYETQHSLFRVNEKEKYKYIKDLLATYNLVYSHGEYKIYERPDRH